MFEKSLILIFPLLVHAEDCKKPENWGAPQALTKYEACLKKQNHQIPLKPKAPSGHCTILNDGSYRCEPKPFKFFEKPQIEFSVPKDTPAPDAVVTTPSAPSASPTSTPAAVPPITPAPPLTIPSEPK
jgi:hypothetical protein